MLILITYDVKITHSNGAKRLRDVAKICMNYGQRVQNSVFECSVTPAQVVEIKAKLGEIIDHKEDNIRIYYLGKNWERRVESMGKDETYNPDSDLLLI